MDPQSRSSEQGSLVSWSRYARVLSTLLLLLDETRLYLNTGLALLLELCSSHFTVFANLTMLSTSIFLPMDVCTKTRWLE